MEQHAGNVVSSRIHRRDSVSWFHAAEVRGADGVLARESDHVSIVCDDSSAWLDCARYYRRRAGRDDLCFWDRDGARVEVFEVALGAHPDPQRKRLLNLRNLWVVRVW